MKKETILCDLCGAEMLSKGRDSDLVIGAIIKDDVCEPCLDAFDVILDERSELGRDTTTSDN